MKKYLIHAPNYLWSKPLGHEATITWAYKKHEKQKYQSSFRTRILVFQNTVFHVNNARYQIKKYLVKYDDACRFTLQNKYYKYI